MNADTVVRVFGVAGQGVSVVVSTYKNNKMIKYTENYLSKTGKAQQRYDAAHREVQEIDRRRKLRNQ